MPIPHFQHNRSWKDKKIRQYASQPSKPYSSSPSGAPKKRRPRPTSIKELIAFLLPYFFMAAGVGILVLLILVLWYSRDIPRPDKIIDRSIAQSTKIYDRTGEHLLFEAFDTQRRTIIPLEQIPEHVKWSTILIEDKKFYEHGGFDMKGIIRAIVKDILTLSKAEGASTLTQQLVKNALLTNEKAWSRKMQELVIAYQIERKFGKDQILQMYFNEIPYGSNAYGIESASQFYFGSSAQDLTIAQGAIIAALPRATTYYSPYGSHVDALMARKDFIISLLEEEGKITPEQAQEAREEKIEFTEKSNVIKAPHFVIWVREQLAEKYGEREVEQGGMRVITTLDWDMQRKAEEAIEYFAETNKENYDATNASLVAIDPKTGQILAMLGSKNYFDEEIDGNFNVAVQGKRQPGSSFKPFVYMVGLSRGYTDKTTLWDVVTEFGKKADGEEYSPKNYDSKERGPVSLRTALQGSLNIPAVKMLYLAGPKNVISEAKKFGYTTFGDPDIYGLSLVLGGAEVNLLEHTAAYATLANNGVRQNTASIMKVEDAKGKILEEWLQEDGEKAIDENIVKILTNILSDNNARAPFFGENNYLTLGDRPVASKTGTTNDYRDAWLMGYTPSLATGVWVGNNDFSAMKRGAGGSTVAGPIWNRFMRNALDGTSTEQFSKPEIEYPDKPILRGDMEGGTPIKIDRASGLLATEMTPESFIEEKIFRTGHNILFYVDPEDPTGPVPSESDRDGAYPKWEKAVQRWMEENDWKADEGEIPTEYDNVHVFENKPSLSIISPYEGETLSGDIITFKAEAFALRGISRVEFYVDERMVSEGRSEPYTGRYIPNMQDKNGYKTLKAIAYDDIDNSESAIVNFNLFIQKTNLTATWSAPKNKEIFDETEFPIQIKLEVPDRVSQVQLFAAPASDPSQYTLIRTIASGEKNIETFWNTIPKKAGTYEIYAILTKDGIPSRVNGIEVVLDVPEGE
ncbi:MAG: hypothetical protein COW93_02775 [Parcubacteria group bacterium CG22_combo_CG10-13_8_21_14_all_41_9]|nr:MAG: hypothetical protein COW93_02775 [Parcubacteria group bacterium CG22_combo_CG10-13_8_21_14_all_41_9]